MSIGPAHGGRSCVALLGSFAQQRGLSDVSALQRKARGGDRGAAPQRRTAVPRSGSAPQRATPAAPLNCCSRCDAQITTSQYLKRRDELFSRIRIHALATMVGEQGEAGPEGTRPQAEGLTRSERRAALVRSRSYILLDLRPEEEHDSCHIASSMHYPVARLPVLLAASRLEDTSRGERGACPLLEGRVLAAHDRAPCAAVLAQQTSQRLLQLRHSL